MKEVRSYLSRVAQRDCNTLLLGETGTGKDLVAQAIHANSPRRNRPFVCINCAAIPDTLLESELFGYERGAFTGANIRTMGKIEQGHGGTIFFDEIGEMTPYAQAKILRVIEDRQIQRLGGRGSIPVNVRILSATNQNLPKLIAQHRFRKDLYFRLNVACIYVPPLRQRREDIAELLRHYVRLFNHQTGCCVEGFAPGAIEYLQDYDWPGNVRELRNFVESLFVDPPPQTLDLERVMCASRRYSNGENPAEEKQLLLEALAEAQGNKSKAAERLHWSRMTVYRKIAKYKLDSPPERCQAASAG
jgi:transcriptional regulator with PAS, ATPase and Fis domain